MHEFRSDLKDEKLLSEYLDDVYRLKGINFERVFDLDQQHKGIDIIINVKSLSYLVDEKAQLHYLNYDLPTFTFELSYLKEGKLKDRWLFDPNKLTQYYFLITGIYLKDDKTKLESKNDIAKLKVTSLCRESLISYLESINLSKEKLLAYDSKFRSLDSIGKNTISELNPVTEGLIYFSGQLVEKPINLQLRLNHLIINKIAKKFHYV